MSVLSIVYAVLSHVAAAVLVFGTGWKIWCYARTPVPLKIPTPPVPRSRGGVVWRLFREVVLFESLFKANKWIWLFGWLFHFGLFLVLLRHLRYFVEPVWFWVVWLQPLGKYASFMLVIGLAGLWLRRLVVDRVRYISSPSDHLMLLLLLAISLGGMAMTFGAKVDIVATKAFFIGLLRFDWQPLPEDGWMIFHITLVALLMIVFPASKLLHAPGLFFSPTRNQADNARERRHVATWALKLEATANRKP